MHRVADWFTALLMLVVYIIGIGIVLWAMAREACAAEFYVDLGKNGQVRIFNKPCATDAEKMGGYLMPKMGKMIWACWIFKGDRAHVWFEDGSYMAIPWSDLKPVIDGSEYVPPDAKKHPVRKRFIET